MPMPKGKGDPRGAHHVWQERYGCGCRPVTSPVRDVT
jgi:hypothetical protein